jgi:hypothetical protein
MFTASTPEFPIIDPTGHMYGNYSPFKVLQISAVRPWHKTCNGGFRQLQTLGIKKSVIRTLLDLTEFAQAVQLHLPKQDDESAMDRLGDMRNLVQHRLLCLPKPSDHLLMWGCIFENGRAPEEEEGEESDTAAAAAMEVYRSCWLAAFLFSTHVTFPIPATRQTRENLVPQLQDAIGRSAPLAYGSGSEILLWCTMIGGIASQDGETERRCWYVGQLQKLCHTLDIGIWAKIQELMRSFAWVDVACDEGGYRLWMEAFPFYC